MSRSLRAWWIGGGALTLVVLVVYAWLAPHTIVDGDNAEFSALGAVGGRAHPSGYPAYVLYLRAMSWLPGASPAHSAALATVLLAVAAVWVLHAALRAWGVRPVAATFAVGLWAASPVVLRTHVQAEVFAMNALVVSLVLWLSAKNGPAKAWWRSGLLGLVAGLGLGNQLTCVLVGPVGLVGAIRGVRESATTGGKIAAAIAAIAGLVLGLASYLYLFVADSPISFGRVDTVHDVLSFFLRTDYGGAGAFIPGENRVPPIDSLLSMMATVGRGFLWAPIVLGLGVFGYRIAKPLPDGETRIALLALAACIVIAGPLLVLRFNIPPHGLGLYVVQRFHLLPLLLCTIPVGLGLDWLGAWIERGLPASRLRTAGAGTLVGVVAFVASMLLALPWLATRHSPAVELGARNLLRSLPANAVVVVSSEDLCFAADYLQFAEDERRDVTVACWLITSRDWYRQRLANEGVPVSGDYSAQITRAQALAILATGRPLLVDRAHISVASQLPTYPYSTVIRVLPPHSRIPDPHVVFDLNFLLFSNFDLAYPRPAKGDDFAAVAHTRYAATWIVIGAALEKVGDVPKAEEAIAISNQLAPERP